MDDPYAWVLCANLLSRSDSSLQTTRQGRRNKLKFEEPKASILNLSFSNFKSDNKTTTSISNYSYKNGAPGGIDSSHP